MGDLEKQNEGENIVAFPDVLMTFAASSNTCRMLTYLTFISPVIQSSNQRLAMR